MDKTLFKVTPVNTSRGAPMGRTSWGMETMKSGEPMYLADIPLMEGYDAGGVYWGNGDTMFVLFNDQLEYYFRARSMAEGIADLTKYGEPYTIIPTESDSYITLALEYNYQIKADDAGRGWRWTSLLDNYSPNEAHATIDLCYQSLSEYIGYDEEDETEAARPPIVGTETFQAIVISMSHMQLCDSEWLISALAKGEYLGVINREYGFDVYDNETFREEVMPNLSEGTQDNISRLFDSGYSLLCFDQDGPTTENLVAWTW